MAEIRPIIQLGHPTLRGVAAVVSESECNSPTIQILVADLLATLAESGGVGIAAPQLGAGYRVIVIASRPNSRYPEAPLMDALVMVNPDILEVSDELDGGWEGCLSVPGLRGRVRRHRRIRVSWQDCKTGLTRLEQEFAGFPARIFQHEFDHLNGTVFVDRVSDSHDFMTDSEYLRQMPN